MSFLSRILILFVIIWVNYNNTSIITIQSKRSESIHEEDSVAVVKPQRRVKCDEDRLLNQGDLEECIKNTDVIQLNVGGEIMMTTRETLTRSPKSILSIMFNGDWEQRLPMDKKGNFFLDFNPILFRHLLDQLQILDNNNIIKFHPPSQPSLIEPFKKMLKKLNLNQFSSLSNNIITYNVGGQIITNQRKTFDQISNSTLGNILKSSNITKFVNKSNVFLDYDPKLFQHLIKPLRKKLPKTIGCSKELSKQENIFFTRLFSVSNVCVPLRASSIDISTNATWNKNGQTVGGQNPTLSGPHGIYVDDEQTIYVADIRDDRIVAWKSGETNGKIVAGGNGQGNGTHQLNYSTDVIVDKATDSLIICDAGNKRVVRWPRQNGTSGEIIISNIFCWGLTMDDNGFLYVIDVHRHEVRRYRMGESQGIVVVGGNGRGNSLDQLNFPTYICVDQEHSIFVSDKGNHRVMKWIKGAKEGIVVAGGQGQGNSLTQLSSPQGVVVDQLGTVYVADSENDRIVRWSEEAQQGNVIVGGNGWGEQANQLHGPVGLSFDRQGNLYVVDHNNERVQRFNVEIS